MSEARKPLSRTTIIALTAKATTSDGIDVFKFARLVERAHGIGTRAASKATASVWVSADERLPPLGELVLGWDGALGVFSRDKDDGGWLWSKQTAANDLLDPFSVQCDDEYAPTHWVPLPHPPTP